MLRKYASEFLILSRMIEDLKQFRPSPSQNALLALTSFELDEKVRAYWPGFTKLGKILLLPSVSAQINRIESRLRTPHTNKEIIDLMAALGDRLDDELNSQWFLHVPDERAQLYLAPYPFGHEVALAFQESCDDLRAASQALALGLGTATVFHLMRAMESAVQCLCRELKIDNLEREWGKLLSDIGQRIRAMPNDSQIDKDIKDQWSKCHANLFHVKQAWRNRTMHPRHSYEPEEADEVFKATQVFMKHLATLISAPPAVGDATSLAPPKHTKP